MVFWILPLDSSVEEKRKRGRGRGGEKEKREKTGKEKEEEERRRGEERIGFWMGRVNQSPNE